MISSGEATQFQCWSELNHNLTDIRQCRPGLGDKFIHWSIIMVKGGTLVTKVCSIILFAAKCWPSVQQRGLETTLLSSFQIATVKCVHDFP